MDFDIFVYSSAEAMRTLRRQRKQEGVCIGCGSPLDTPSKRYCLACKIIQRKSQNKRIHKLLEQGLCPTCKKPLDREGFRCTSCTEKQTIRTRRFKNKFLEKGICPRCTKNPVIEGLKYCYECQKIECTQHEHKRIRKKNELFRKEFKSDKIIPI